VGDDACITEPALLSGTSAGPPRFPRYHQRSVSSISGASVRNYTATEHVWDGLTRWFHWSNVVLVCLLAASGLFLKYRELLHVSGGEAKMALKAAHSLIGYAFALNLAVRIVWGFRGNVQARWQAVLPDRRSLSALGEELRGLRDRLPVTHLVRSPVSRLSATLMFVLMLGMAFTGLSRAGTDLYYLPLGPAVAAYVAKPGVDPSSITWRTEAELADEQRLRRVGYLELVTGLSHLYGSWILLGLMALHIAGVTLTEMRQRSGLISTMVSGRPPFGAHAPPSAKREDTRTA
jgi:Ni/Fe-hydrogenase 1 B-type cytochrome subunit